MNIDATRSAAGSGATKKVHKPKSVQKTGIRKTLHRLRLFASYDDRSPQRKSRAHHHEAEIALLREENAYLRMKAAAGPSVGRAVEMIGKLEPDTPADDLNHAWQAMVESLIIRDTLIDACRELNAATLQLENRLVALSPQGELFDPSPHVSTPDALANHATALARRHDKQISTLNRTNLRELSRKEVSLATNGRTA